METSPKLRRITCDSSNSNLASVASLARAHKMTPADNQRNRTKFFENYITKKELAQHFKVSQGLINRLMAEEFLPHIKIGRAVRFRLNDVYTWFERKGNKL